VSSTTGRSFARSAKRITKKWVQARSAVGKAINFYYAFPTPETVYRRGTRDSNLSSGANKVYCFVYQGHLFMQFIIYRRDYFFSSHRGFSLYGLKKNKSRINCVSKQIKQSIKSKFIIAPFLSLY